VPEPISFADDDHALIVKFHHLVTDGWSQRLFWQELEALYTSAPAGLPKLPVQYRSFVEWQRSWLQTTAAETQLGYTAIVSPLDGRMGMRLIDKGNIVHAGDPGGLVVITQVQPIAVIFSVPQDYLQAITAAMKQHPLKVSAYSRDNFTKLGEGTLLLIDNQIDASTGTLRLKASFPNEDDALWPGQFVNARLELAMRNDAVAVPAQVIQRGPNALYAYVVKQDQTVERRMIKVGPVRDGLAVIEEGLAPGERVVVDGQFKLRPGAKVAATMMPDLEKRPAAEKTAERSLQIAP